MREIFNAGQAGLGSLFLAATLVGGWTCGMAAAQTTQALEIQELLASDGAKDDLFGKSVAVDGNVAVVGALGQDVIASNDGAAYVFRYDTADEQWKEEQMLFASDGQKSDVFGYSVAVSGDVIVVGAMYEDEMGTDAGAAYVFRYVGSAWVEEQKLEPPSAAGGDWFGFCVSISDDVIVIGAPFDDGPGLGDAGAAYVYRYKFPFGWMEEEKLEAAPRGAGDQFGRSACIDGDVIVAGAPANHDAAPDAGAAYVFRWDGADWIQEQTLIAGDGDSNDWFGYSAGISGERILIGAPWDDDEAAGVDAGSAYLFENADAWSEIDKFVAPDATTSDRFGYAVAIHGDVAAVGADQGNGRYDGTGSAYVYRRCGSYWNHDIELNSSDGRAGDQYGQSVALDDDTILVGATYHWHSYDYQGSAYIYGAPELTLDIHPNTVTLGDNIAFLAYHGNPDAPIALAVVAANGAPVGPMIFLIWTFASDYQFSFAAPAYGVPPGTTVTFQAYKLSVCGGVARSNTEDVLFQ